MRNLLFISVGLLFVLGCEKDQNTYKIQDVTFLTNLELFDSVICFSPTFLKKNTGIVITNEIKYNMYADSMRLNPFNPDGNCNTATLVNIDFSKYSLIGISTSYGGCDTLKRNILHDEKNNKLIYEIDIKEHTGEGCFYFLIVDLNVALIPKLPDDYKVDFSVKRYK